MQYKSYQHVERWGNENVEGIECGKCMIFPKIDGTNGTVFLGDDGEVHAGSRRRELTLDKDNANFYDYVLKQDNLKAFLRKNPRLRLYGEWLVPHTLRTYRKTAWNKFYVFDVAIDDEHFSDGLMYLPYDQYQPMLEKYGIEYIPPLAIINNPDYENLIKCMQKNDYLIEDGHGVGEGIVIKNYSYCNKFGRTTWAKIVASEFKEKHIKTMGAPVINGDMIEERIVFDFCTSAFVEKEYAKIVEVCGGWKSQYIPRLLNTVYHELVTEEMWSIVRKYRNPTINFKTLYCLVVDKIKSVKPMLF